MPGPLRAAYQKAEAKYNVTTDFTSLGLHAAAATGNVGLAEYALDHGQPINSVLDGVLPLHAACAGGNVQVVKLLIDHGADVNAPRLPRRYSNEKNRDTSVPIVGTSGSTPLHFAAANGNTQAVTILLLHGAHADRPDKHGVTPEMLARQNGWLECADVLNRWMENKDRDLKERPCRPVASEFPPVILLPQERSGVLENTDSDLSTSFSSRRRLHVKQSFDTAISLLKSASSDAKILSTRNFPVRTPPESPLEPLGEGADAFSNISLSDTPSAIDVGFRRPSLPHIFQSSAPIPTRNRKTSSPPEGASGSSIFGAADAGYENLEQDRSQPSPVGRVRKLGSKYSLLNIFKKAQTPESGQPLDEASPASATSLVLSSPDPPTLLTNVSTDSSSTVSQTLQSRRHKHAELLHSASQQSLSKGISATTRASPGKSIPLVADLHNSVLQEKPERHPSRDRSRSGSKAKYSPDGALKSTPSPISSPLARLDVIRGKPHQRERSGSDTSSGIGSNSHVGCVVDDSLSAIPGGTFGHTVAQSRILVGHNRTSSAGPVPGTFSSLGSMRKDPIPSSNAVSVQDSTRVCMPQVLRLSSSVGSLPRDRKVVSSGLSRSKLREEDSIPDSAPPTIAKFDKVLIERSNEKDQQFMHFSKGDGDVKYSDSELRSPGLTLLMRERGLSLTSTSDTSLSPILSNDHQGNQLIKDGQFLFGFHTQSQASADATEASDNQELLQVPGRPGSSRGRRDSTSSQGTTDSRNRPPLSTSDTASGSGSDTLNSPWLPSPGREPFVQVVTDSSPGKNVHVLSVGEKPPSFLKVNDVKGEVGSLCERPYHFSPNLNIRSVSSHAQAEALVQKAQREILDLSPSELSSNEENAGRSPLGTMLAAYGESLALERKFRLEKEGGKGRVGCDATSLTRPHSVHEEMASRMTTHTSPQDGVSYRHSPNLGDGVKDEMPTRPPIAQGASGQIYHSMSEEQRSFHHPLLSTSASSHPIRLPFDDSPGRSVLNQTSTSLNADPTISTGIMLATKSSVRPSGSNDNQIDGVFTDCLSSDLELGPSIYRTCTAPLGPVRGSKTTAAKLTKMGFPSTEQARNPPPKRFGAIRSLVQTLKGKP